MNVKYHVALSGSNFDPKPLSNLSLETKVLITDINSAGDIGLKGRYKNKPYDFGYVCLQSKDNGLDDLLSFLSREAVSLIVEQAESRELHLCIGYENQCNWEFTVEEISKMHALQLILTLTCYRI